MENSTGNTLSSGSSNAALLPRREYGRTGISLSIIGFGGIVVMNAEQNHANRVVAEAVERGVNYFDVAPSYGDAELRLGPALKPYRDRVFLACKTGERTKEGAKKEFEQSLERLYTDHFDLYQLHGITDVAKDVDAAFAKGGVMELLAEEKRVGRIRHLGFSAHSEEAALTALDRFDFDSVLFPFNFATFLAGDFGPRVLEFAQSKGAARLALKAMARQQWPEAHAERQNYPKAWYEPVLDERLSELALRWTLSLPITAAIPPGEEPFFRRALDVAANFRPITKEETGELVRATQGLNLIFHAAQ